MIVGGGDEIRIYAGPDPDPSGEPTIVLSSPGTSIGVADMNGDGYVDLATGDAFGGRALVGEMNFTGSFSLQY